MKTKSLFLAFILVLALGFTSCKNDPETETVEYLVTFEDVDLGDKGYWNGSDESGKYISGNCEFINNYTPLYSSWMGFSCSSLTDTETSGLENQYSVIAGEGVNKSKQFAVACFDNAEFICRGNQYGNYKAQSMMITNSTYAYLAMKNGDNYTKIFEAGDWFKVIIKGYRGFSETGTIEHYLAKTENDKIIISDKWEKVDISILGEVDKVVFSFDSSDKTGEWLNNPAYVCIDNILFTQEVEK